MATITQPAATRAIAVTTKQPLHLVASATVKWSVRTNGGAWSTINASATEIVWESPSSVTNRFTFDRVEIAIGPDPDSPDDTLDLNLCEGPVAVLHATDQADNPARRDPPLNPNASEGDDPPLGAPWTFPGANRDGFATVVEERAGKEPSGPANLVESYRSGLFVDTAGKLGARTSVTPGQMSGLGPFPQVASYHHGGMYFHHDFGRSRTLALTRVLFQDADSHVAVVRGDGRRVTYRWNGAGFDAAAGVQSTLTSGGGTFTETTPSGRAYHYNSSGALTEVIDRYGQPAYYSYDANSRLQKIQGLAGTSGLVPYLSYNGSGLLERLVFEDPSDASQNRATYFSYDGSRNLTKILGPELCVTYYSYSGSAPFLLTGVTDPEGFSWAAAYDGNDRADRVVDARGNHAYFSYDTAAPLVTHEDRAGKVTYLAFNAFGSPTTVFNPATPSDYYAFDGEGNLTSAKNRLGNQWSFEYDGRGNRISATDPLSARSYFAYDGQDLLRTFVDPLDRSTYLTYDGDRDRERWIDATGNTTYFTYGGSGLLSTRKDRRGGVSTFVTDGRADLTKVVDPLGHATYFGYNSAGEVTEQKDALFRATTLVRDLKGRVTRQVDPIGAATYFAYDARCNLVSETDARLNTTTHSYDGNSNRTRTVDALGNPTYFGFDAEDRPNSVKNARLFETTMAYGGLGLLKTQADALGGIQRFDYDDAHELTKQRDERNNATYFAFDAAGRLSHRKNALLEESYFGYDLIGNQVKTVDPRGNATYMTFDALDRQTHTENQIGAVRQSVFDAEGNMTRAIDPLGQATYFTFDLAGRQTEIKDQLGNVTTAVYDVADQVTTQVDPLGNPTYFEYDLASRAQRTNAPSGLSTYMAYDLVGNQTQQSLEQGWGRQPWGCSPWGGERATTYFAYDAIDRQTSMTDALGGVSTSVYDRVGNMTRSVNERGFATYFTFDALDRQTHVKDGVHFAETYMGYDAASNVVIDVDQLGHAAYFTFDRLNRQEFVHDRAGALTYFQFDAAGNQTGRSVFLGAGGEQRDTYFSFDAIDRQTTVTDALGGVATTAYDLGDNVERVVDQVGRPAYFGYDVLNRQVTRKNALGNVWTTVYDERGSVTREVDPVGRTTYFEYDAAARQVAQSNVLGETARSCFDARGNETSAVNPRGNATYFSFDLLARRTHREDQLGGVSYFGYDSASNQVLQLDELSNPTYFTHDGLNRLTHAKDAAQRQTYFGYDARGSLVKRVSAAASAGTTYMNYDAAARLQSQAFAAPAAADAQIDFTYDQVGNVTLIQDGTGKDTVQEWDKLDRLTKKDNLGGTVYYAWDASGMKTSLKDPSLDESVFVYDDAGRLEKVEIEAARTAYYVYDTSDMLTQRVFPGGPGAGKLMAYYRWDLAGRQEQVENRGPTYGDVVNYFHYERDANGLVTHTRHDGGAHTYWRYDALDRLTQDRRLTSVATVYSSEYVFDAAGNRTAKSDLKAGEETYFTYDVRNLLEQEWNKTTGATSYFSYDDAQRMTARRVTGSAQSTYFSFNQRDQVTGLDFEKSGGADDDSRVFDYSGAGERVRLKIGTGSFTETYMAYDIGKLIREADDGGNVLKSYRQNADFPQGNVLEIEDGANLAYAAMDWRGSLVEWQKQGGSGGEEETRALVFDAFGNQISAAGFFLSDQRLRFVSPDLVSLNTSADVLLTPGGCLLPDVVQLVVPSMGLSKLLFDIGEGAPPIQPERDLSPAEQELLDLLLRWSWTLIAQDDGPVPPIQGQDKGGKKDDEFEDEFPDVPDQPAPEIPMPPPGGPVPPGGDPSDREWVRTWFGPTLRGTETRKRVIEVGGTTTVVRVPWPLFVPLPSCKAVVTTQLSGEGWAVVVARAAFPNPVEAAAKRQAKLKALEKLRAEVGKLRREFGCPTACPVKHVRPAPRQRLQQQTNSNVKGIPGGRFRAWALDRRIIIVRLTCEKT